MKYLDRNGPGFSVNVRLNFHEAAFIVGIDIAHTGCPAKTGGDNANIPLSNQYFLLSVNSADNGWSQMTAR